jgi:hypothetical protein
VVCVVTCLPLGLRSGLCGGWLTMGLRSGLCCGMFTVGTEEGFVLWRVYRWD